MGIKAVIFDWGGTLTPWHDVDLIELWGNYAKVYAPERADELATQLHHAEQSRWSHQFNTSGEVGTGVLNDIFLELGIDPTTEEHHVALASYLAGWDPYTYTDSDAMESWISLITRCSRLKLQQGSHIPLCSLRYFMRLM